jgi:hypothetical protein
MGVTIGSFELTPCTVNFNGVDLGGTLNNVEVTIETQKAPLVADQYGKTELDGRVSGHVLKVKTKLAEVSNKDLWTVVFPYATKGGSGGASGEYIDYSNAVGYKFYDNSKSLILHPQSRTAGDKQMDFNFDHSIALGVTPFVFGPEEQQGLEVEFQIYPNSTTGKFFRLGDPTL